MTEKEYIEREAAIEALTERNLVVHMDSVNDGLVASCHRSAQRIIANIPAADVRPVVLCRDCDCWNDWDSAGRESLGNYVCSCAHWTTEDGVVFYTKPTDFCSYGEKREES